jgi:hypothetical protein
MYIKHLFSLEKIIRDFVDREVLVMAKIDLKKLTKKCTFYYFIFGIVIGVIMLIYSLINNNFAWNI